jgi:hypothetical protein
MADDDYFLESVPDGIANGVQEHCPSILCSGNDAYELLVTTFGKDVDGSRVKKFTEKDCRRFAKAMQEVFGRPSPISPKTASKIINHALLQWGG